MYSIYCTNQMHSIPSTYLPTYPSIHPPTHPSIYRYNRPIFNIYRYKCNIVRD